MPAAVIELEEETVFEDTLAFEYVFGHYVAGKSWHEINEIFNLAEGDLFIIIIIVTALSPWLAARFRGLV